MNKQQKETVSVALLTLFFFYWIILLLLLFCRYRFFSFLFLLQAKLQTPQRSTHIRKKEARTVKFPRSPQFSWGGLWAFYFSWWYRLFMALCRQSGWPARGSQKLRPILPVKIFPFVVSFLFVYFPPFEFFGARVKHLKARLGDVIQNLSILPLLLSNFPLGFFRSSQQPETLMGCALPENQVREIRSCVTGVPHPLSGFVCRELQICWRWNLYLSPRIYSEGGE